MPKTKKTAPAKGRRRIAITFPQAENEEFGKLLRDAGARVLEMPLGGTTNAADNGESEDIVAEILESFGEYDWLVFADAAAVHKFFHRFFSKYKDLRSLGPCRIACADRATARAVENLHLQVDCVAEAETGAEIAEKMLAGESVENLKICVVPAASADASVAKKLEKIGRAIVDSFPNLADGIDLSAHPAAIEFREKGADFIVFASEPAVRSFIAQAGVLALAEDALRPRVVAIGDPVAAALKKAGVPVAEIFKNFSDAALAELIRHLA
ncbi:MAG: uroporphyrinogen-III synthase [Opitutae bacterium]|nr:uroporphyrinogen-III synthase [Opitutae bacterium]